MKKIQHLKGPCKCTEQYRAFVTIPEGKKCMDCGEFIWMNITLKFYCDNARHLVCVPYSVHNLHLMAQQLDLKRAWFHKHHYDIPVKRIAEISSKCEIVSDREIVRIKNGKN